MRRFFLVLLCWLLLSPGVWGEASRDWDAVDDVVYSAADKTQNYTDFSILFWINPDTEGESAQGRMVAVSGTGGYLILFFDTPATNRPKFAVNFGTEKLVTGSTNGITLDVWQTLAVTFTSSNDDTFLYGVSETACTQQGSQTVNPGTTNITSAILLLGADSTTGTFDYDGSIGYIQWWNTRVLTCRELLEARYFPCSEPNGLSTCNPIWGDATEVDLSGSGTTLPNITGTTLVGTGPPVSFGHQMPL